MQTNSNPRSTRIFLPKLFIIKDFLKFDDLGKSKCHANFKIENVIGFGSITTCAYDAGESVYLDESFELSNILRYNYQNSTKDCFVVVTKEIALEFEKRGLGFIFD